VPSLASDPTPGDFTRFYPVAHAETQAAHPDRMVSIACTRPLKGEYVSLLADRTGTVVLAAFSRHAPSDAEFLLDRRRNPEATRDWAYVWDRNADGKVDYLAYYLGTDLVDTSGALPPDFPRGKSPKLTADQLDCVLHHMRQTFYHAADDNFDGKADAAVYPHRDAATSLWVKGFFAVRSSRYDGRVEDDWAFAQRIDERLGPAPRNANGFRTRIDPAEGVQGEVLLGGWNEMFAAINSTIQACGLGNRLRRE